MRKNTAQSKSFFNSLVTVFLAAVLSSEGLHYSEHHNNPHGNRRERIEELRQRAFETNHDRTSLRSTGASGGNPPPPSPVVFNQVQGRRRLYSTQVTVAASRL